MLTAVERVIVLRHADLLKDVGPRHLLALAELAHEVEIAAGDTLYGEDDPSDVLYLVVEGRVRLSAAGRTISEVGANESFGTWALVDDSGRGQQAVCTEDGLLLALHRDEFYDVAAADLTVLIQVVRALARRLRELVAERPEEARVESEGVEKTETETEPADESSARVTLLEPPPTAAAALTSAALGQPAPTADPVESEPVLPGEPPPMAPGATSPLPEDDRP